jgi:hypothetical protein
MADIALTAAQIAAVKPEISEIIDVTLAATVTKGQALYLVAASGKYGVADANDSGKEQVRGIALKAGAAGETIPMLKRGPVAGFTISGMNYDAPAYLSNTAGALADAAGTMTVVVGRVIPLNDSPTFSKVLWVDCDYSKIWA